MHTTTITTDPDGWHNLHCTCGYTCNGLYSRQTAQDVGRTHKLRHAPCDCANPTVFPARQRFCHDFMAQCDCGFLTSRPTRDLAQIQLNHHTCRTITAHTCRA